MRLTVAGKQKLCRSPAGVDGRQYGALLHLQFDRIKMLGCGDERLSQLFRFRFGASGATLPISHIKHIAILQMIDVTNIHTFVSRQPFSVEKCSKAFDTRRRGALPKGDDGENLTTRRRRPISRDDARNAIQHVARRTVYGAADRWHVAASLEYRRP